MALSVRAAPQPGAKAGSPWFKERTFAGVNSGGVIRGYKKFSQKSIDILLCVQLKGALSPACQAGELTTGKNKKSGK
jgi:hypothetical protein